MQILGIDSSGMTASVAVADEEKVLAEYTVNHKKTHSQTLLPMLDEIVKMLEIDLNRLDAVAVAKGPGSFTGLRIGSSTVKGLSYALNLPVVSVPTLEGLAYNLCGFRGLVCPIMDARRSQVYTGIYSFEYDGDLRKERMAALLSQCAISIEELCQKLNNFEEAVAFTGDGVPVFKDYIKENLNIPVFFAPPHMSRQRAAAIAALGMELYKEGKYEKASEHRPEYLRVSQAERERENARKAGMQGNADKAGVQAGTDKAGLRGSTGKAGMLGNADKAGVQEGIYKTDMRKMSASGVKDESLYFRTMEKADLPQVLKMEQEYFSQPWTENDFINAMENKNNLYAVACAGSNIQGYCGIWGVSGEGQICNVAVKKECRKQKIGFLMLDCAIKEAACMGNREFTLEVRESNAAAVGLYEKLGFKKEGIRKEFYKNPTENGIIMWKR